MQSKLPKRVKAKANPKTESKPDTRVRISCQDVNGELSPRIDTVAEFLGVSASDVIRMGLKLALPEMEKQLHKAA